MGYVEDAIGNIRSFRTLLIPEKDAIELVEDFLNLGLQPEAKTIFELSEPRDLTTLDIHESYLDTWAELLPSFYNATDIVDLIDKLEIDNGHHHNFSKEELKYRLLFASGRTLVKKSKWHGIKIILEHINKTENSFSYYFNLLILSWKKSLNENTKEYIEYFSKKTSLIENDIYKDIYSTILLAELKYHSSQNIENVKKIIQSFSLTNLSNSQKLYNEGRNGYILEFRLVRIKVALLPDQDIQNEIFQYIKTKTGGQSEFRKYLLKVAVIWGKFWTDKDYAEGQVVQKLIPGIRFFNREFRPGSSSEYAYEIFSFRREFFKLIIDFIGVSCPQKLETLYLPF